MYSCSTVFTGLDSSKSFTNLSLRRLVELVFSIVLAISCEVEAILVVVVT